MALAIKYLLILLISICVTVVYNFALFKKKVYKNLRYKMAPCCEGVRYPIANNQSQAKLRGGIDSVVLSNEFEIIEEIHSPIGVRLEVRRCQLSHKNDCRLMPSIKIDNVCNVTADSPFMKFVAGGDDNFEFFCPVIKKQKCSLQNCKIDLSVLAALPMEGFYWKIKQIFSAGEPLEDLVCITIEGTVLVSN